MQKLGTPYLLLFHVETRAEFFSFHTLILNPKMFPAYKIKTELKFYNNKGFSYALLLGSHRYHIVGEAAWLIEPLDDRVSAYIRKSVKGCRRPKELQSRAKEFVRNQIFFQENPPPSIRLRFYPNTRKEKNIVNSIKQEVRHSKIDQENLMALTENWRKSANTHFTPK